jgi:hypothetical protein
MEAPTLHHDLRYRAVVAALDNAGRMDDAVRLFLECCDRGLLQTLRWAIPYDRSSPRPATAA